MKRALICSMGVVALMAGVEDVYAQARPAGVNAGWEWYASVGPIRRGKCACPMSTSIAVTAF